MKGLNGFRLLQGKDPLIVYVECKGLNIFATLLQTEGLVGKRWEPLRDELYEAVVNGVERISKDVERVL